MSEQHISGVEAAKQIKSALRRAFPRSKFSVRGGYDIRVQWTDDGPDVEQVRTAILEAGLAEAREAWNGNQHLSTHDHSVWLDCYNITARAAEAQDRELRHQEYEAGRKRVGEAVNAARRAKDDAEKPIEWQPSPPAKDPAAFEAFERLRLRAESDVTGDAERSRRPTWAPPMILGEELAMVCLELGYLTEDNKWIGRLWATFATPKRSGQYLREHISSLPLTGISCRGFQFHVGEARGPVHQILFEAQRTESGEWRFGPRWRPLRYWSAKSHEWERLAQDRERHRNQILKYSPDNQPNAYKDAQAAIEKLSQQIGAIETEDAAKAQAHNEQQLLHGRALELARLRVLDFIGAPDAQMQLAGRLWGRCCICGKELTDPISLERGIGPECLQHKVKGIQSLRERNMGVETIVEMIGMPTEFVTEVIREMANR